MTRTWRAYVHEGSGVQIGVAYMFELSKTTARDKLIELVHADGGEIIAEDVRHQPPHGIARRAQTVYTIIVVFPQ